jgi:hypothetical protein
MLDHEIRTSVPTTSKTINTYLAHNPPQLRGNPQWFVDAAIEAGIPYEDGDRGTTVFHNDKATPPESYQLVSHYPDRVRKLHGRTASKGAKFPVVEDKFMNIDQFRAQLQLPAIDHARIPYGDEITRLFMDHEYKVPSMQDAYDGPEITSHPLCVKAHSGHVGVLEYHALTRTLVVIPEPDEGLSARRSYTVPSLEALESLLGRIYVYGE